MKNELVRVINIILIFVISVILFCANIGNKMPPIVTPNVIDTGTDYATINWNNVGSEYKYGIGLSIDSIAAFRSEFDTLFTEINDTIYTISNLEAETKYWFRVITYENENSPDNVTSLFYFLTK